MSYLCQERDSEVDGARLWKQALGSEMEALSLEEHVTREASAWMDYESPLSRPPWSEVEPMPARSPPDSTAGQLCPRVHVLIVFVECFLLKKVAIHPGLPQHVSLFLICLHVLSQHN